jgi:hypothetical protein
MELDYPQGMTWTCFLCGLTEGRRLNRRRRPNLSTGRAGSPLDPRPGGGLPGLRVALCILALVLGVLWAVPARAASDNGGLGLLPIGDQFPPKLKFLTFTPEPVLSLSAGTFQFDYQFAVANTIVNTQYDPHNGTPKITQTQVTQGLTAANFPAIGFGAYLDMETERQLLRFRLGVGGGVELGLDQGWVSFGGGGLDSSIDSVEGGFNGRNPERVHVAKNQFHYYVYHNGRALVATSAPVGDVAQDPVLSLKWNPSPGGELLPALGVRLAYKAPLDSATGTARSLVSSGHDDWGYSVLLSKAVGRVIAHLQMGESLLSGTGSDYVSSVRHQFFGLEFRTSNSSSVVFQTSSQSTVYNVGNVPGSSGDFQVSRPADVFSLGYKYSGSGFRMDLGITEDYNSRENTTDFLLFFDLGWRW